MSYLVDANVLSEPTRPEPSAKVLAWLRQHEHDIHVDPVILGEVRFGILRLPPGKKRRALEEWFEAGVHKLTCLSWEADSGLRWAELLADLRRSGRSMSVKDSLIATTALVHGLVVATRDVGGFRAANVEIVNPFEA